MTEMDMLKTKRSSVIIYDSNIYRLGRVSEYFAELLISGSKSGLLLPRDQWGDVTLPETQLDLFG